VDVTSPAGGAAEIESEEFVLNLSKWLVDMQPITLAINNDQDNFGLARQLFEKTGQCVYTVGCVDDNAALTCQARPQEGEIFGEFPVRRDLGKFTTYPMVVPSPTPAYNSTYAAQHLQQRGAEAGGGGLCEGLIGAIEGEQARGYARVLRDYLVDACASNPKEGEGERTILFGLQRPPLNGQKSVFRCGAAASLDELAPYVVPFMCTNASGQFEVSVDPANAGLVSTLQGLGVAVVVESDAEIAARGAFEQSFNYIDLQSGENPLDVAAGYFPLAGQFVSTLLCVGHVKSTKSDDQAFLAAFKASDKWLKAGN
jgi:hypothetical protein